MKRPFAIALFMLLAFSLFISIDKAELPSELVTTEPSGSATSALPAPSVPPVSSAPPRDTATSVPMAPSPPPPIIEGVYTDYSMYAPRVPDVIAEIYTRISEEPLPELLPSDSYGELLPYSVAVYNADYVSDIYHLDGLVTTSGMIVTDPVFDFTFQLYPSRYIGLDIYDAEGMSVPPVFILRYSKISKQSQSERDYFDSDEYWAQGQSGWMEYFIGQMSIEDIEYREHMYRNDMSDQKHELLMIACASDASWISERYDTINQCDLTMLLIRDKFTNDADIMDYYGNILYNTKSLPFYDMLPVKSIDRYSYQFWEKGYFMFRLINGSVAFVEELTGEHTIVGHEESEEFTAALPPLVELEEPHMPNPYYTQDGKVFRNDGTLLFEIEGRIEYLPRQNVIVVDEYKRVGWDIHYKYFLIYNMDGKCVFRIALDRWLDD
jgi:hypothetical protein